jgi:hypothetical protein
VSAWNDASSVEMSIHGWIALGLGTFFSLLIGCGLMALMFYSNRSGHDDVADPFRKKKNRPRCEAAGCRSRRDPHRFLIGLVLDRPIAEFFSSGRNDQH